MALNHGIGKSTLGHSRVGGREYPEATRPETVEPVKTPTITHTELGQKIDGLQRKMREFKNRHEDCPRSFIDEMAGLLAELEQEEGE